MRATGDREEELQFIQERSGVWKLASVSTFSDERE
jgi:hypothetical protein